MSYRTRHSLLAHPYFHKIDPLDLEDTSSHNFLDGDHLIHHEDQRSLASLGYSLLSVCRCYDSFALSLLEGVHAVPVSWTQHLNRTCFYHRGL